MFGMLRKKRPEVMAPLEPRVFSVPVNTRIYAVGDIHGKDGLLKKMLAAIATDAQLYPDANIVEVYLGDYVDRGMGSREVIDLLLTPSAQGHERIFLKGNHEEALLKFVAEPMVLREWATFGGYATLASYGIQIPQSMLPAALDSVRDMLVAAMTPAHLNFLKNLRLSHSAGDYFFVHAGIHPQVKNEAQEPRHLLWIREPFLSYSGYFEQYIVHGHTPVTHPDIRNNRANMDVSAAAKNSLAALVLAGTDRNVLVVTD